MIIIILKNYLSKPYCRFIFNVTCYKLELKLIFKDFIFENKTNHLF